MRFGTDQLVGFLGDSYTTYVVVDVLHGTDRVAQDVVPVSWELSGSLSGFPRTVGRFRFVHQSVNGESWVPVGADGVLSPLRATLLVTQVVVGGLFEERVQLGLFDVVAVPFAEDTYAHANARFVSESVDEGLAPSDGLVSGDDLVPFSDEVYVRGGLVGGRARVVTSTVEVEVASLDVRVVDASLRAPKTVAGEAVDRWREFGLLPVVASGSADLGSSTFPAERGSRLKVIEACASALGGVPAVNSAGQWVLLDDGAPVVELVADGDQSTVVDITHQLDLDSFANVVVGSYEAPDGSEIYAVWEAPGELSPAVLGREWVRYHSSDWVKTADSAREAVASVGALSTAQEVDVPVVCVDSPLLEIGDRVSVTGWVRELSGVAVKVDRDGSATMTVTVRVRRSFA